MGEKKGGMFAGALRLLIIGGCLFIAWSATGEVLATAWQKETWKGFVGAAGVELVLAYAIYLLARTNQKAMVGVMIVLFGGFSIGAQILHSAVFGVDIAPEIASKLPYQIVWMWQYLLPSVPTIAAMCVGILDVAEKSDFDSSEFFGGVAKSLVSGINDLKKLGVVPTTEGEKTMAFDTGKPLPPTNPEKKEDGESKN